jgi:hypothetical protein
MDPKELRLFREAYGSIYATQKEEIISESECEDEDEMEEEKPSKKDKKNEKKDEEVVKEQSVGYNESDAKRDQEAAKQAAQRKREAAKPKSAIEREGAADRRTQQLGREAMRRAGIGNKYASGANEDADLFDIVKGHLVSEGLTEDEAIQKMVTMTEEERNAIAEQYTINVADVKGGTEAAKRAAAGMKDKSGKPMYKPGVGVGPDFKLLKGV